MNTERGSHGGPGSVPVAHVVGGPRPERRQQFVLKLMDALRLLDDPQAIQAEVDRRLAAHLGADRVFYGEVGADGILAITTDHAGGDTPPLVGRYPLDDFGPHTADTLRSGRTLVFADIAAAETLSPAEKRAWAERRTAALVAVPLMKQDRLAAVLAVHQSQPRNWHADEIALLEELAERTRAVMERAKAEAALRASEANFRNLFDTMGQGYALLELIRDGEGSVVDHRILEVNPAFERLVGLAAGAAGGHADRTIAASLEKQVTDALERVVRTSRPEHFEQWAAGPKHWFDVRAYPAGGDRVSVLYENIDRRKRAEAVLRGSEERQAFLLQLGDSVRDAAAPEAVADIALRLLADHLGLDRAWIGGNSTRDGRIGIGPEWRRPGLRPIAGALRSSDFPESDRRVAEGTLVVEDVASDSTISGQDRQALTEIDLGAFICAGLRRGGGGLVWVLVAATAGARAWTPGEIELVEDAAERTWAAMERARAEEALRGKDAAMQQQAQTFDAVLSSISDFAYILDLEGRFTYVNRACLELWGLPLDQAVGRNFFDLGYPPDLAARIHREIQRVIDTKKPVRGEAPYTSPTGVEGYYEYILDAVFDAQRNVSAVAGSTRDVSERKRSEHASNLLATIVEYSDDAMVRKDLNGIIETWNAGAERMFGYAAAEVIGKSVTILMPPDRVDEEPAILARLRQGERVDHYETVRQRKDGSLLDVSLSVSPIRNKDGEVIAASKVVRDITLRRRVESALRESERRQGLLLMISDAMRDQPDERAIGEVCVRMLAEHMRLDRCCIVQMSRGDDQARLGPEYRRPGLPPIRDASGALALPELPAALRQLETETVVVAGQGDDARVSGPDEATGGLASLPAFVVVPVHEGPRDCMWALMAGSTTPREWTREEVHLVEDVVERTWAFVERARAAAALRESEAKLQRANHAKDEFLAMLGHELRNPLAPITTTLELMKLRSPAIFARERGVIEGQVRYLTGLVDDLLDVSRIVNGKIELKLVRVDLGEIVAAAVETTQAAMEQGRQTLRVQVDDGLVVSGDRRRLVQVVVNLLTNAAKYSPPDRTVYVSARREDGHAVVRIRDEGQGIAPALLPHVFESFTQGEQSIERASGGLGLGLAIVRNVVSLHGGSVSAASDGAYKGSEFTVRLPLFQSAVADADGAGKADARPRPDRSAGDDARVKVLIVDDYPLAADSLAMLLQEMGYRTRVARDGAEGLKAVKDFSPHLALIDIGLPVIDGYEVAQSVRTMPGFERLPLVAVTGYGQASDRARVLEAGFNEHLVKPLDAARIGELIERLVVVE